MVVVVEIQATTTATTDGGIKLVVKDKRFFYAANCEVQRRERLEMEEKELERPNNLSDMGTTPAVTTTTAAMSNYSFNGGGGVNVEFI